MKCAILQKETKKLPQDLTLINSFMTEADII